MSITLTSQMFAKLSPNSQKELLASFRGLSKEDEIDGIDTSPTELWSTNEKSSLPPWKPASYTPAVGSAFESASLSFSQPLTLPSKEPFELKKKTVRHAAKVPIAVYSDIYSLKGEEEIEEIISDIDLGYFVGPPSWVRGQKHHPENFDVRRVLQIIRAGGSANSYTINMALMTLCRTRIAAILRQLKIQGIVNVSPAS